MIHTTEKLATQHRLFTKSSTITVQYRTQFLAKLQVVSVDTKKEKRKELFGYVSFFQKLKTKITDILPVSWKTSLFQ